MRRGAAALMALLPAAAEAAEIFLSSVIEEWESPRVGAAVSISNLSLSEGHARLSTIRCF